MGEISLFSGRKNAFSRFRQPTEAKKVPVFFEKHGDFLGKAHHFCAKVAPLGATVVHGGSSLPALRLADGEGESAARAGRAGAAHCLTVNFGGLVKFHTFPETLGAKGQNSCSRPHSSDRHAGNPRKHWAGGQAFRKRPFYAGCGAGRRGSSYGSSTSLPVSGAQ